MLARRLQAHQVDDVDDAHAQLGELLAQHAHGGERLERRDVAGAGHDDVGIALARRGGPVPDAESARRSGRTASSIVSHVGAGCLPATMTLT